MAVEAGAFPSPFAELGPDEYLAGTIDRLAARGERLALSITETAELLGISRGLAYDLARRGELPTMLLGRRRVVPRAALAGFVAQRCDAGTGDVA